MPTRVTWTSSASLAKRVPVNFGKFSSFYFIFQCISDRKICLPECQSGSRNYDNISEFRNIKVNLKVKVTEPELKGNDDNSSLLTFVLCFVSDLNLYCSLALVKHVTRVLQPIKLRDLMEYVILRRKLQSQKLLNLYF